MDLAAALARQGKYQEAVDILSQLIDSPNVETEHYLHRTFLLLRGGLLTDSGVAAPPNGAPLMGTVLQAMARKAMHEPYARLIEELDSIDADVDTEAALYLSDFVSLYGDSGSKFLEDQLKALRADAPPSRVVDVFLARLYLATQQSRPAADLMESILARYGDDAHLRYLLATAYDDLKIADKTEENLRRCIKLDPNDADALNFLGYFLAEHNKNLDEAEEMLEKALETDPENGFYLDSLGWIYYRKGDADKAVHYIHNAIRAMKSDDAVLRDHMGDAYLLDGDVEKAVGQWRRAHRLDPKLEGVLEKLEKYAPKVKE
jgi:tetratricopeptide (TPR) repeat protein